MCRYFIFILKGEEPMAKLSLNDLAEIETAIGMNDYLNKTKILLPSLSRNLQVQDLLDTIYSLMKDSERRK
jgi:hypothetical protein